MKKDTSSLTRTFRWQQFAAINHLELTIPEDQPGGVLVLEGDEGTGKSTAIESLNQLAQDKPKFPYTPLDGHKLGLFEGPGVLMRLHPSTTRMEQRSLKVTIMNGVPLGTFIDPRLKGDKPRSEARNRALASLVNLELTDKAFDALCKGSLELKASIIPAPVLKLIDAGHTTFSDHIPAGMNLLTAADVIRSTCLSKAQELERQAEIAGDEASRQLTSAMELEQQIMDQNDGDFPALPSTAEVMAKLEDATREAERKRQSYEARKDLEQQQAEVRAVLEGKGEKPKLEPVLEEIDRLTAELPGLQQALGAATQRANTLAGEQRQLESDQRRVDAEIQELEQKLAAARARKQQIDARLETVKTDLASPELEPDALTAQRTLVQQKQARLKELQTERDRIQRDHREREQLQAILDKSLDGYADDADVQSADLDIDTWQSKLDQALLRDRAAEHTTAHQKAKGEAEAAKAGELWHRDVVWNVIPSVIASRLSELGIPGLEMRDGVLFGQHPKRGMVAFDELSPGQTVRVALMIAMRGLERRGQIPAAGQPVLLPLPQESWDAMTPRTHAIMRYEATQAGVWIVTATARRNGDLRVNEGVPAEELEYLERLASHGELEEGDVVEKKEGQQGMFR